MTEQAPSALADTVPHSAADASATVSTDSTVPIISAADASATVSADSTVLIMPELDSHHGAAILVRVSQVNGCF